MGGLSGSLWELADLKQNRGTERSVWDRGGLQLGKQLKEIITRILRLW